jgi:hypothetical protein
MLVQQELESLLKDDTHPSTHKKLCLFVAFPRSGSSSSSSRWAAKVEMQ